MGKTAASAKRCAEVTPAMVAAALEALYPHLNEDGHLDTISRGEGVEACLRAALLLRGEDLPAISYRVVEYPRAPIKPYRVQYSTDGRMWMSRGAFADEHSAKAWMEQLAVSGPDPRMRVVAQTHPEV